MVHFCRHQGFKSDAGSYRKPVKGMQWWNELKKIEDKPCCYILDQLQGPYSPHRKISQERVTAFKQETMVVSKRISYWTVAEVFEWVREQYPSQSKALQQAIAKHAISGRVLLRMKKEQLSRLGIESKLQQEFLRDVLLLRIQEELENLNNIYY
uniref:SAM domain-containing protein n=1 Tax=Pygocentrus nattereri TaxID=42514 RepID=A0AAR2LGL1_PYGNA